MIKTKCGSVTPEKIRFKKRFRNDLETEQGQIQCEKLI